MKLTPLMQSYLNLTSRKPLNQFGKPTEEFLQWEQRTKDLRIKEGNSFIFASPIESNEFEMTVFVVLTNSKGQIFECHEHYLILAENLFKARQKARNLHHALYPNDRIVRVSKRVFPQSKLDIRNEFLARREQVIINFNLGGKFAYGIN